MLPSVLDHIMDLKQENTDGPTRLKMTVASATPVPLQKEDANKFSSEDVFTMKINLQFTLLNIFMTFQS